MKKLLIFLIGLLPIAQINAQDISDALRYSIDEVQGSARFSAMSGAFGALGGDLSAVSINPAGAAVFNRSYASLSLSSLNNDNTVGYFNGLSTSDDSKFDLHQTGAAFVFSNNNTNSPWRKLVLSIAYDKTGNYDDNWFAIGTNNRSIDQYFLAFAQDRRLDEISAFAGESLNDAYADIGANFGYANQQAFLGYEAFIIDPTQDSDDNLNYISNIGAGTFEQEYSYNSRGYNGKVSFNVASQFKDNLYFGLNLNSHFINYERSTFLFESNSNAESFVSEVGFENNLVTTGTGFSFQLGTIAKISEEFRVGLTYNSPTWFTIFEETTQFIETLVDDGETTFVQTINPQTVNVFPEYRLKTPSKITGSLAYVFGDKGLISFDYSRKDYSNIEFRPTSDVEFQIQNDIISNTLKASSTYRIGGEYRSGPWSLRGGYRMEESPNENETLYGDLTGYSLGLGYSFGNFKLDLSYANSDRTVNNQLYSVGLTDRASVNTDNRNISLSLGFSL